MRFSYVSYIIPLFSSAIVLPSLASHLAPPATRPGNSLFNAVGPNIGSEIVLGRAVEKSGLYGQKLRKP